MNKRKIDFLLSQYIDGELDPKSREQVEKLINDDERVRKELRDFKLLKKYLSEREMLPIDLGFWTRLSVVIDKKNKPVRNIIWKIRENLVRFATVTIALVLVFSVWLLYNRTSDVAKPEHGQYKNNILSGALVPLFPKVDKEKALQFSLFGSIPLDEKSDANVSIDSRLDKVYKIEVGRDSGKKYKRITLENLMTEIKPSERQKRVIDSLLELTGKQIERSVLIGENNTVVIAPGLSRLNEVVMENIFSCLEHEQKLKFQKLLKSCGAQKYFNYGERINREYSGWISLPSKENRFVIITPDTLAYSQLSIDFDSLEQKMEQDFENIRIMRESMIRRMMRRDFRVPGRHLSCPWRIQVFGDEGSLSIELVPRDTEIKEYFEREK